MSLSLKRTDAEKLEYDVMHGEWQVGRIWYTPETRWCWTFGGIAGGPDDLLRAGVGATLPEARAELDDQWAKWLAYAKLEPSESSNAPPRRSRQDQ